MCEAESASGRMPATLGPLPPRGKLWKPRDGLRLVFGARKPQVSRQKPTQALCGSELAREDGQRQAGIH